MADAFRAGPQPVIGPRLADIEAARSLTQQTRIARREGVRIDVRPGDGVWVLRFNQKNLELPETADTLAEYIAQTGEFVISEAPQDLGPSEMLSCIQNLVREGALRVVRVDPA